MINVLWFTYFRIDVGPEETVQRIPHACLYRMPKTRDENLREKKPLELEHLEPIDADCSFGCFGRF